MYKIKVSEDKFLEEIVSELEKGENIERSLFNIKYIPEELKLKMQIGTTFKEILQELEFETFIIQNLLNSLITSNSKDSREKIKITIKLIKKRDEVIKEKKSFLQTHRRRIGLIRIITLVIIGVFSGFYPLYSNLYGVLLDTTRSNSGEFLNIGMISFFFINILNNYFLLKMADEKRLKYKLAIVGILHIIIVKIVFDLFTKLI